ncbi:MAG: VWA domain-containing protein [Phycisphaerales bacterium]|nr:MAG: VWA domain-containing protein [Phycisphaerales bacterium]
MTFTGIPLWATLALAAGATAAIALLHLLRVRPRELRVVTTLFWAHAAERTRARTLLERFRHPLTFALLLAFCLLLVLALARPEWTKEPQRRVYEVIIVDAGLSMGARDRPGGEPLFDAARAEAIAEANRLSSQDRLAVVVTDPHPRLVHRFEDPPPMLRQQLSGLEPADVPAATGDALRLAGSLLHGRQNPHVVLITDRPGDQVAPPAGARSFDLTVVDLGRALDNAAILSALFEPDDKNPLRGRFAVRAGYWGESPREMTLQVARGGGAPLLTETRVMSPGETSDYDVADLPCDGDELVVTLSPNDALEADSRGVFHVPLRAPIRVGVEGSVPEVLRIAMEADRAVTIAGDVGDGDVDVVVGRARPASGRPAIIISDDGPEVSAGQPITVAGKSPLLAGLDLTDATCGSGASLGALDGDARPLLTAGDEVVAAISTDGALARVYLSSALTAADADIGWRPAFAILVARALRSLAGWDDDPLVLAPQRVVEDPLWARRQDHGGPVVGMPGSRRASDLSRAGVTDVEAVAPGSGRWAGPPLYATVLILALGLFLLEAVLHARGRIS